MSGFSATGSALRLLASLEANAVDDAVHIDARLGELASLYAGCADHIRLMAADDAYAATFTAAAESLRRRGAARPAFVVDAAGYSDAQLDGTACINCGKDFPAGALSEPAAMGPRGQMFEHVYPSGCGAPVQARALPVSGAKTRARVLADAVGFDVDDVVNVVDAESPDFGMRGTVVSTWSNGSITVNFGGGTWSFRASQLMHHAAFVAQMDAAEQQAAKDAEAADDAWSASEQFEHDQASEAAADYAASLEPGIEADL